MSHSNLMVNPNKREGSILVHEGRFIVETIGQPWLSNLPGIECLNPQDPPEKQRFRKVFQHKKIYLPSEYDQAVANHLACEGNFILGANGYSELNAEMCRRYGIQVGEYEQACAAILRTAIENIHAKFPPAQLRLVSGASFVGVDGAIEEVAAEFNIPCLGFSCPEFMMYVHDDDRPVYVAINKYQYADAFIRSLDLLCNTGGREHAYVQDIMAIVRHKKRIHFIDVLNLITRAGSVPATISKVDGSVVVDNAPALFSERISFFGQRECVTDRPADGDNWDALMNNVRSISTEVCREKLPPPWKFGKH